MNETGQLPLYDRSLRIASMSLFCLTTLVGNSLYIVSYTQLRWLRTPRHAFIINLAIADLIMGCFGMPMTIGSLIRGEWLFAGHVGEDFSCQLAAFLDNTVIGCSVWFLALSSFDRYLFICKPLHYTFIMTKIRVRVSALAVWVGALFLSSTPVLFWGVYGYSEHSYNCGLDLGEGIHRYYFLVYAVIVILAPVMFSIFNFTSILLDLKSTSDSNGRTMFESNKGAVITLLVLTLAFVVCSLPLFITAVIYWFDSTKRVPLELSIAFHWMLSMNSAVNPVLYGLLNPKLRAHYYGLLTCVDKNKVAWVQSRNRNGFPPTRSNGCHNNTHSATRGNGTATPISRANGYHDNRVPATRVHDNAVTREANRYVVTADNGYHSNSVVTRDETVTNTVANYISSPDERGVNKNGDSCAHKTNNGERKGVTKSDIINISNGNISNSNNNDNSANDIGDQNED